MRATLKGKLGEKTLERIIEFKDHEYQNPYMRATPINPKR